MILVGATMWLSFLAHALLPSGDITRIAVWLVSAFIATQITRRTLVDLESGVTTIAAIVSTTIVAGIVMERRGEPMQLAMLGPIVGCAVGAVLGALTSRRPRRDVQLGWRLVAAGLGSFGLGALGAGLVLIASDSRDLLGGVMIAGAGIGSFILALRVEGITGRLCALGLALAFAMFMFKDSISFANALGLALVAGVAAVGGSIGARIRTSRRARVELPEAQVR
jgi:hypothetical protein